MIKREAEIKIKELKTKYPVLLITGPRQSGKTTLVKKLFPKYTYKNLEIPDLRLAAKTDPKKFLGIGTKEKMIIDEIQEVPELTSYIQAEVDEQEIKSHFILTGSQNFQISQTVTQSLAGRVSQFELLPLSYSELSSKHTLTLDNYLYSGSYPRLYTENISPIDFFRDYVNTYITRDLRSLKNIGNLTNFQRFMQLLAGRVGQLFNATALANEVGVDIKTIQNWLSVLEASYISFQLQPYYENFGKRLIKSSKIYFYDTGLVAYLLGINSISELKNHFAYGSLFENLIISEYTKKIWNSRLNEKLYFWRDKSGTEIDLFIDKGLDKTLIEIKSSQTFRSNMLPNLHKVGDILEKKYQLNKKVIYQGSVTQEVNGIDLINWTSI